jgi:hypothetical protein
MNIQDFNIAFVTADIVYYIVRDTGASVEDAMRQFYSSELFDRLADTETGLLYRESSAYVYDLYKTEQVHGHLVQLEV